MNIEWTVERINERPRNTLISIGAPGDDLPELFLAEGDGLWLNLENGVTAHDAEWILDRALPGEVIQIVGVPVEALLSEEALNAGARSNYYAPAPVAQASTEEILRAVVAHVIGEKP